MPKHKQKDESSSDSDSGPDDRAPVKKSKPESKQQTSKPSGDETNWPLSKNRAARLTEFKGKWYVDIREFYTDDSGDQKPGRKGIMLTMEQWQKFKNCIESIDEAIKKHV